MSITKRMFNTTSTIKVSSIISPSHELQPFSHADLNTTFSGGQDPWRMIRNSKISQPSRDLRLIVHGSKGGKIHPILSYLIKQVQHLRGSSVELEILTKKQLQDSNSSSIWLIPLLLLPGKHVRNDVPRILDRLRNQGIKTNFLPFLGSWPQWLSILEYLIRLESNIGRPILLHHPLNKEMGSTYLNCISRRLNIPIIPWTEWHKSKDKFKKELTPIPYCLFPNKNTELLRQNDSISSLIEIDFFLFGLIKMLVDLP